MTLISEKGVTVSEKINDVGALIKAEKESKKSKMGENPTTYAYDVYYDYDEVHCSRVLDRSTSTCHVYSGKVADTYV